MTNVIHNHIVCAFVPELNIFYSNVTIGVIGQYDKWDSKRFPENSFECPQIGKILYDCGLSSMKPIR